MVRWWTHAKHSDSLHSRHPSMHGKIIHTDATQVNNRSCFAICLVYMDIQELHTDVWSSILRETGLVHMWVWLCKSSDHRAASHKAKKLTKTKYTTDASMPLTGRHVITRWLTAYWGFRNSKPWMVPEELYAGPCIDTNFWYHNMQHANITWVHNEK